MTSTSEHSSHSNLSPFREFDRQTWSDLATSTPLPLMQADLEALLSLGDPVDLEEVDVIYRPLSALLQLYAMSQRRLSDSRAAFLREPFGMRTPYVIGIAGSVAVGKSSTARLLQELMKRWPQTPRVELITTDGFLYPNAELARRGLMTRKGFPESYDRRALLRFLTAVKAGNQEVSAPVYSHITYDIVPGKSTVVRNPEVLIVEGLNVLQPAQVQVTTTSASALAVSDFFDFSIYVDARERDIKQWYVDRFLKLRSTTFTRPDSYFHNYADLSEQDAIASAHLVWDTINSPNLRHNILPTRSRASLVITKDSDHRIRRLRLRKL